MNWPEAFAYVGLAVGPWVMVALIILIDKGRGRRRD